MKRLFAIILTLCLVLGVLPEALAYDMTTHTHKWSQWYPEGEAGCVYGGARYRYCTECWTYEYEETPPLGHVPTRQVREEPTCTKPGYYITVCSRCGQGLDNGGSIPALGHDYKRSVAQEATCTSDGMAIYTCSRCGDAYREPIPATGHKWGGWTNDTPSTCVSYGTRYHVCQRCGTKEWERNYADGLGDHDWGEWKVIKEPAVGVAGLEERVCKNDASHKEQREIPAIGVEIDVFLDYNEKWLPEKYVIGSKIELDMYTYNYSNVPVTLTETEITEHPIGDLIDPWPDINGTVIQPGASFHWVLTIYINGADGMVGEAIRHIYQSYSYSEGVPAPITGQTNTIEVHYPIEEETQYVLKGEKQNFSGCSSTVGGWKLGYDTGAQCIWQDAVPDASLYRTDYTPLYSDSDNNINLTDAPMAGESYYFHISVLNDAQGDHSIDFTQVDPAQVDITSDVFTIELLGIEPYVSDNDRDGVLMYFKATYQSVEPALLLEVKQISPEQESYHPKDRVDLDIILTNTGNVPLKTPGYFIIYGGKEHPAQFVESAVLAPGESVTIKDHHFIFDEEDLAEGQGKSVIIGQAWLATAEDGYDIRQLGGNDSAVVSNTVETIWPVTEGNPQLYLEIKQTTPEQESYHPGERVDLEVILTNTGNMSLMLPSYFLVYDDGMSLGKLDESTVLAPGESISFNNLCFIFDEEHAAEGKGEVKAIGQAWATSTKDDADTDQISQNDLAVQSNLAEISWLVTPSEPQLYLEIKQVSPEQETYYVNDTVDLEVTLTNTGNVSLKAPGYFLLKEDSDILLKYDESAELAPGESITFTGLYYAFRNEDLLEGNAKVVVAGQAWLATSADGGFDVQQFGGNESAVISNYVEMNWPMSAPELQLEITQVSPWKAVYEEGDSIDLKITLSNFGSTPLSAPCYFFDWAYDGSRWYTYDDTVINPGESAVFFETVQVWKEDVDMGYMGLTFNGQAWDETAQEIEKTVLSDAAGAVHSNTVEMIWPTAENEDAPALFLEVSWAPDEGIGKVAGDTIREHFKLTNTGNVNMLVPACLDHSIYEDIVQPNWYLDFGGVTFTVLKPGWSMEWTFLDEVFPEDVEAGRVSWSAWRSGYVLIGEEERGMRVDSNLADIDIPLSNGSTLPKEPALKLTTIVSPMKASYPYAELYSECDVVKIDFVLINTGDVPLYIDKLLERWGDGNETFIPLNILLYPGESYSDYTNVWLVTSALTPNSQTAGVAGTVDIELYALGRDWDDTDTVLCETDHSEYSFMMVEPGPADWEIPGESVLQLIKYVKTDSALPEGYQKGEQIIYVVEVWNIGEVEVTGAVLTESLFGIKETLPTIPVDYTIVKEYVYTVTEDDVLVGGIYNEALVEWTDPDNLEEKSDSDWMLVYTTDKTSLMLKKEIVGGPKNGEYYVEGEEITFQVTAKNNTDTVLPLVFVNEPLLEGDSETLMEINDMQPGAEQGEMFKYKVTEGDVSLGYVGNMATSEYEDANGDWHKIASNYVEADTGKKTPIKEDETPEPPVPPYKPVFGVVSDISITKEHDKEPDNSSYFVEGEKIRYAITVKNEGEVPVDIEIYDSLEGGSGLIGTVNNLAPNDSKTVYYEYTVTKADVDATCVVNYALAKWHPSGIWAETVYKSNEVVSPTSEKQPNPDGHFEFSGEGDSCWREVTGVGEFGTSYTLNLCAEHAAIEQATQMIEGKKTANDWQKAVTLWREAVDAEYEKYLEAADGSARVTVINERLTYYLWLGAYEKQLKLLYPDDPDAVAQKVAESLMDRCADLCCGEHEEYKEKLGSLTGARMTEGLEPYANCDRIVTNRSGNEISYEFVLDAKHAATEKNALTLVREAEVGAPMANAWARAQQLWQMALDKEVNALYKAAGKEDRQVIAMTRRFLDQLVAARTALLEEVYSSDSVIVNEQIERLYKEYAMILCGK